MFSNDYSNFEDSKIGQILTGKETVSRQVVKNKLNESYIQQK